MPIRHSIPRFLGASLFLLGAMSCAARGASSSETAKAGPRATSAPVGDAPPAADVAARPPVPVVTAPMAGEPEAGALAQARLDPSNCAEHASVVAAQLQKMNEDVDKEFQRWHDEQPQCWADDRRRDAERRAWEECQRTGTCGGLGLSGIGEGGSGIGEGIGLGSIGTIGHGRGAASASTMSATNNQISGVDEGDIIKTDGRYVYMAVNGALRIVEALSARQVSVTRVTRTPAVVREMLVEGDRAALFSSSDVGRERCKYAYDCEVGGDGTRTRIDVYDIADRTAPKAIRTITLTGSLMASRRIGTTIHAVVADGDTEDGFYQSWPGELEMCGTPEAAVRRKFAALRATNERRIRAATSVPQMVDNGVTTPLCAGLLESKFDQVHTFTSIVSFDMTDAKSAVTTAAVRARPGTVFASDDALYIASHRRHVRGSNQPWYSFYSSAGEVSEIHKFRIGGHSGDTKYLGSGVVPGHVLNQFAMDEWHGYLRIATTTGRVPDPETESAVSIFAQAEGESGNLVRVGAAEHIARGEDLRAIRFDDDRGYIVTFKKTDPLFVLDLYDVTHPQILGELKIPGFSTYLHRIDPTHLLSIGFDANDHGDFAFFDGVLLQLFDVTHPTDPKLIHREKIGSRGSSSAAATDHLAFNYFPERKTLALPMTVCGGGGDGINGSVVTFSGLELYHVDLATGFEHMGGVSHGSTGASCDTWWSKAKSVVQRSVFLDDLVYSMALDRVKVQRVSALGKDVADISLRP